MPCARPATDAIPVGMTSSWVRRGFAIGPIAASKGLIRGDFPAKRNNAQSEEQKILIGALREGRIVNHGDTMVDST